MKIERRRKYKKQNNRYYNNENKIDINFDLSALNLMCSYALSENRNIKRSHLVNMRNLFDILNIDVYLNDVEKMKRITFIKKGLEARLDKNLKNASIILKYINGGLGEDEIIDSNNFTLLSTEELEWINETISESLKYSFMYNDMNKMLDLCTRFQAEDYKNRGAIVDEFEGFIKNVQTKMRRANPETVTDTVFSLKKNFEETMRDTHERLTNESRKLYTGMQGFNELLGGAFQSSRVYMLLGLTGGGKSLTLLDLAYQMKKYNSHYIPKDPTKTPVILYITQENSVDESISRLFSIATNRGDMESYSADEAINLLKEDGELYLNDDSPIDLMIRYIPDKSIDTGDLYGIIEDLEDEGYEVIALIQDHIKKIRSVHRNSDLRLELGDIVNEFKVLANLKDIVVVTNSHLNRDAANRIDEACKANKSDLIRLLGRANIGESMLMLDNIDGAFMIAQEYDSNGNKYLGIQRIKKRYKASDRDIIFQPYVDNTSIQLVEDINFKVPVFKNTLLSLPNEANMNNQSGSVRRTSVYQNNVKSIEELNKQNESKMIKPNNMLDDINIFRASRYRAQPLPEIEDDDNTPIDYNEPEYKNPFIRYN